MLRLLAFVALAALCADAAVSYQAAPPTTTGNKLPDTKGAVPIIEVKDSATAPQPLVLSNARIVAAQRQDVPSERDGKLLFLATPIEAGETVPPSKRLELEITTLAIEVKSPAEWNKVPAEERVSDDSAPSKLYRKVRTTDSLGPGSTVVVRQKVHFRKLDVGDRVREGQLLGVINPALARQELVIKQVRVEGADADVRAAIAFKEEAHRSWTAMRTLQAAMKPAVTLDEIGRAKAAYERYKEEENAKRAVLKQAEGELSQAWATLKMHEVRASIDGVIKSVYKQTGEGVRNLEPVLQIHNPARLRALARVEVADAVALRNRLEQARKFQEEARRLRLRGGERDQAAAREQQDKADDLLAALVEVSRAERPRAALIGHLKAVTCVAVSKGPQPWLVSGSEDQTVRIWQRDGLKRWRESIRLPHGAAVKVLACTGKAARKNLLLTATATGRAYLFDLDNLTKAGQVQLRDQHDGAIDAVAFSADGSLCASGGEDRSVCLWGTATGKLLARVKDAHKAAVTSLAFTSRGQLISAGKDGRLIVWNLNEDDRTLSRAEVLERGGTVGKLGAGPGSVLLDEGRELRVVSLANQRIEGILSSPAEKGSFSTLALYAPDGKTILTGSRQANRLQLWRAPTAKTRAAELRTFAWTNGAITSAAFDPAGAFAVAGTQDARVLVWQMPTGAEEPLSARLEYVEESPDSSTRGAAVHVSLDNPGWIMPGAVATVVVPPRPGR